MIPAATLLLLLATPAAPADEPPRFASEIEVVARPSLTVEEVLARHRAAAARQAARVPSWIATGDATIVFLAPGVSAPMTVTAAATVFRAPGVDETELADVRLNGVPVPAGDDAVPRLPIVEPPPVDVAPLDAGGDAAYRYRLLDADTADGVRCYVVWFEPRAAGALLRGRAWIAEDDFGLVRLDAEQAGLRGAIVSSRRVDAYRRVPVADEPAWLLERSARHDAYDAPGHRTPIDRVLALRAHEVGPDGFEARRRAAHASSSVLLAAVDGRLQYLRRESAREAEAAPLRTAGARATKIWTLAAGVLADPGIDGLLPYVGLGYLDLDVLGTGTRLNAFAAGPFVQAAWSAPVRGWQVEARAFASLVEYNDRSFRNGAERYDENVRQRPASGSLEALAPPGRWRARVAYDVARPGLRRGPDTAAAFVAPANPTVHSLRLGLETEAAGWSLSAWGSASRRSAWTSWGTEAAAVDDARDFQKAGLRAARAFVLAPRAVARLDLAAMAGRDLDRFSRFAFDGLENRLHGAPLASVRFDRGLVLRTSVSTALARGLRADGFVDAALVRDPTLGGGARAFPGLGAALQGSLRGALSLGLEWGYGPRSRDGEGRPGAHVWRLTAYKIL